MEKNTKELNKTQYLQQNQTNKFKFDEKIIKIYEKKIERIS